jgi:hypothetical protein
MRRSDLAADGAIDRIWAATSYGDREKDQAPKQGVLISSFDPDVPVRDVVIDDDGKLDHQRDRDRSRQESDRDADCSGGLQEDEDLGKEQSRLDAALRQGVGRHGLCAQHQFGPAVGE